MFATKISIDDLLSDATVTLADAGHRGYIESWQVPFQHRGDPKVADIVEYGELALSKWADYERRGRCPNDWPQIRRRVAADRKGELGALFVLTCAAVPQLNVLAFAFVRRTWANNLVIDFLATNPHLELPGVPKLKGAGTALLVAICQAAHEIDAPMIWGEATSTSWEFYEKRFGLPVTDLFRVDRELYVAVLRKAGLLT